ncbi:hypothetical protein [Stappia stellulata]|uniref:hypothetical protein n=1 Tax=Stappia stellulata TaxID=71235 RepID=UPI00041D6425|nr:hypothetical protein [Stappia stellulata]
MIGSNTFNILGILGVTAMLAPIPVAAEIVAFDIPVMLIASVGLAALLLSMRKMPRIAGLARLVAYGWYFAALLA